MAHVNAYLNFAGNTEEAFNFYKSVFGGTFVNLQRFKDTPHGDSIPAHEREKIMHIALPVGPGSVLMATDTLESMGQKLIAGNNCHLAIEADSKDQAEKLFNGIYEGGNITMQMENNLWGEYFGMLMDKLGVSWMVNYKNKAER